MFGNWTYLSLIQNCSHPTDLNICFKSDVACMSISSNRGGLKPLRKFALKLVWWVRECLLRMYSFATTTDSVQSWQIDCATLCLKMYFSVHSLLNWWFSVLTFHFSFYVDSDILYTRAHRWGWEYESKIGFPIGGNSNMVLFLWGNE